MVLNDDIDGINKRAARLNEGVDYTAYCPRCHHVLHDDHDGMCVVPATDHYERCRNCGRCCREKGWSWVAPSGPRGTT